MNRRWPKMKHIHVYVDDGATYETRETIHGHPVVTTWQPRSCGCGHQLPQLVTTREE